MRIAIGQINCTVGDLSGNARKILEFADRARAQGADVLLTPELSLCGYPPEDLLLREDFRVACDRALAELASKVKGISVVVGHPRAGGWQALQRRIGSAERRHHRRLSQARPAQLHGIRRRALFRIRRQALRRGSQWRPVRRKHLRGYLGARRGEHGRALPATDGVNIGINICADFWEPEAPKRARAAGAQVLLVLNASPYHIDKLRTRYDVVRDRIAETGMAVVFCNLVGGQDELVFDGASFVMDARGKVTHQLPVFEEVLAVVEVGKDGPQPGEIVRRRTWTRDLQGVMPGRARLSRQERISRRAAGLVRRHRFGADIGIAVDALGADKVHAVMMPSQYTASISLEDAREMVKRSACATPRLRSSRCSTRS